MTEMAGEPLHLQLQRQVEGGEDTLRRRQPQPRTLLDPPEIDSVFCFAINPTQGIHDILREAAEEEDYKRIIEAVSNGISTKSIADCHPAAALRSEWDYLSVINGLVVHGCKRIVIPRGTRNPTLQVLHRSHAGVAKTAEAARQLYFWPKMNDHIKDMIDACERCQFYKSSKQKQEQIQQTPFKDLYPMAEVGADLFKAGKHHFLIVIPARCKAKLHDRGINHRAHGENVLSIGQAGGNQMRQLAMLQDRIQELGKGKRHCRQQLRPEQAHKQQAGRTRRRHRQAHAAEASPELRGIHACLDGI
jgi:hypothetical protein